MTLSFRAISILFGFILITGCNTFNADELRRDKEVERVFLKWMEKENFSGAGVLVLQDDTIVHLVRGTADKEGRRLITASTAFQTGSIDKYMATVAAFAMSDEGLIDLDTPISNYLPEYRQDTGSMITLATLLSNRSGLPNEVSPIVDNIPVILREQPSRSYSSLEVVQLSLSEGVQRYASGDLKFDPGSRFDYSNSNWILVRFLLTQVAGMSYDDVLTQFVFVPAGMQKSGTFVNNLSHVAANAGNYAIGYNPEGKRHDGDYPLPPFSGGGSFSTTDDLCRMMHAIYAEGLLETDSFERFNEVQTAEENYAFGGRFAMIEVNGEPTRFSIQSGSNGATKSTILYDLELDACVSLMSNRSPNQGDMFEISKRIISIAASMYK